MPTWHLDRKVPLAVILTIVIQTGGVVWRGSSIDARVEALEHKMDRAAGLAGKPRSAATSTCPIVR